MVSLQTQALHGNFGCEQKTVVEFIEELIPEEGERGSVQDLPVMGWKPKATSVMSHKSQRFVVVKHVL